MIPWTSALLLAAGIVGTLGCAPSAPPLSRCGDACDENSRLAPTELDVVAAPAGKSDGQRAVLAWQAPQDVVGIDTLWLGRMIDGGEVEWLERLPATSTTAIVELASANDVFVITAVDDDDSSLGTSNAITVRAIEYSRYSVDDLAAHVWAPSEMLASSAPIAFLVHGNHGTCRIGAAETCDDAKTCREQGGTVIDSALGYEYLGRVLASKGYVALAIDANSYNCTAEREYERAELLLAHLARWTEWKVNRPEAASLAHAVALADLTRVAFFGHSRGAEAASAATELLDAGVAGIAPIEELSVVSLASSESHERRTVGAHLLTLLPACDGDAETLPGRHAWDRTALANRSHDLYQALIFRANHNFFNRAWPRDDSTCAASERLTRNQQERILSVLVGTFLDATLRERDMPLASRGARETFPRLDAAAGQDIDVSWSFAGADSLVIEDGNADRVASTNRLGGANAYRDLATEVLFWPGRRVLSLYWSSQDRRPLIRHELGDLDASGFSAISFRVAAQLPELESNEQLVDATIRIADVHDQQAEVSLAAVSGLRARAPSLRNHPLQTISISVERVLEANPDLDWGRLRRFEIDLGTSGVRSSIWTYADVELVR